VFGVGLEGAPVLRDFDVAREAAGAGGAVVTREFRGVSVTGDTLDVTLAPVTGEPVLSGVELIAE
jgi:hypothetical protein